MRLPEDHIASMVEIDFTKPGKPSVRVATQDGCVSEFWLRHNGVLTARMVEENMVEIVKHARMMKNAHVTMSAGACIRVIRGDG